MSEPNQTINIAIIGGGPAGVSLCLQMLNTISVLQIKQKIRLLVFEKNKDIGFGTPYFLEEDAFCINLPRDYMVLKPKEYQHFSDWLAKQHPKKTTPFPPRHYFGKYVKDRFCNIPTRPELEITPYTEHHVFDVLMVNQNAYRIHAQHKEKHVIYFVNYVILAIGHLPCFLPKLQGCKTNPWERQHYQNIHTHAHVGIIGTRLSAIDVVLKLHQQNHQGQITLISQSGLLSSVRGEHPIPKMTYLNPQHIQLILQKKSSRPLLQVLLHLLEQELTPHLPKTWDVWKTLYLIRKLNPLKRLQYEIQAAKLQQSSWQSVLSCFYQIIYRLWPKFPIAQQQAFLEKYSSLMFAFLCSFPLEKAFIIQSMMESKQLMIYGGLTHIKKNPAHFIVAHHQDKSIQCDHLFFAASSGSIPETIPLLANMLKRKLIEKHQLGGVWINVENHEVGTNNIYALGDIVKGACFKMIEVGQVVEQAKIIINDIIKKIN